jgi:hypothetical protein
LTLPPKLKEVGVRAFAVSRTLGHVMIPKTVTVLCEACFCTSGISKIEFERGSQLQVIKAEVFSGCASLSSIVIPASVQFIGEKAFWTCYSLASVEFETGSVLKTVGSSAFRSCFALRRISLPVALENLGFEAFASCGRLERVVFASSTCLAKIRKRDPFTFIGFATDPRGIEFEIPCTDGFPLPLDTQWTCSVDSHRQMTLITRQKDD